MASGTKVQTKLRSALRRELFAEDLLAKEVTLYKGISTYHTRENCPREARPSSAVHSYSLPHSNGRTLEKTTVDVETFLGLDLCTCADYAVPAELREPLFLTEADDVARLAEKVKPGKLAPGSVQKKLGDIRKQQGRIKYMVSPPEHPAARSKIETRLQRAHEHLLQVVSDPAARTRILAEVKDHMSARGKFHVDESDVLVAVVTSGAPKVIEETLAAFAIHRNAHSSVLLGPRYLYDYLQREMYRTQSAPRYLTAYPADADPKVNHTAAVLWTPGDLAADTADFFNALKAAKALEGSDV